VSALAFVVVGTAELYTAVGFEHRVCVDAVAFVIAVIVAKGAVAANSPSMSIRFFDQPPDK